MFSNFATYYERLIQGRNVAPLADEVRKEYSAMMLRMWGV